MIPDNPTIESERRQIVFACAVGVPTVFIHRHSRNRLLQHLLRHTSGLRLSRRYPGYWRVPVDAYRRGLVHYLCAQGGELINWIEMHDVVRDLQQRVSHPEEHGAAARVVRGLLREVGRGSALCVPSGEFNAAAEQYYRETLRQERCREGFAALRCAVDSAAFAEAIRMRRTFVDSPSMLDQEVHQYVERHSGAVRTERLIADRAVRWLYGRQREQPDWLLRALTSPRFSRLLGYLRYDLYLGTRRACGPAMLRRLGADPAECLDEPVTLDTPRKVFERSIRYWETRPMPQEPGLVVSPADARLLVTPLGPTTFLPIKEKFFSLDELLGGPDRPWANRFHGGDAAVFRLTPDRYHYNHVPAAGTVADFYAIEGACHSCNPSLRGSRWSLKGPSRRPAIRVDWRGARPSPSRQSPR